MLRLRDKLLPLRRPSPACSASKGQPGLNDGFIVVMQVGSQTFGIVVDGVFHTEEIVVKPMSSKLRHIPMFSGNTILGDGSVIMIIDPNGVAQAFGTTVASQLAAAEAARRRQTRIEEATHVAAGVPRRLDAARRPCRCRSSRGSKKSTRRRSSCRTAATWSSTAAI